MKIKKAQFIPAAVCLLLVALLCPTAHAVVVKQVPLLTMAGKAEYIFSGTCIRSEIARDPAANRDVCLVTFRIEKAIKGTAGDTFTMKLSRMLVDLKQIPSYKAGDEVVLFLYKESALGFTSPVGQGQGRFSILRGPDGTKKVVNANNNQNLFKGLDAPGHAAKIKSSPRASGIQAALALKSGPVSYDAFLALVELIN